MGLRGGLRRRAWRTRGDRREGPFEEARLGLGGRSVTVTRGDGTICRDRERTLDRDLKIDLLPGSTFRRTLDNEFCNCRPGEEKGRFGKGEDLKR